jgi:hypothetical protein
MIAAAVAEMRQSRSFTLCPSVAHRMVRARTGARIDWQSRLSLGAWHTPPEEMVFIEYEKPVSVALIDRRIARTRF